MPESPTLFINQKVNELLKKGETIINLSIGEPDFDTFPHVKEAAVKAVKTRKKRAKKESEDTSRAATRPVHPSTSESSQNRSGLSVRASSSPDKLTETSSSNPESAVTSSAISRRERKVRLGFPVQMMVSESESWAVRFVPTQRRPSSPTM